MRVTFDPGFRHPLHVGAAGRAVLAFLPEPIRRSVTDASPEPAVVDAQLEEIRRHGYARSHDELQAGLSGIAVPVFSGKALIASLSLVVPISREAELESWAGELVAASARIGEELEALHGTATENKV